MRIIRKYPLQEAVGRKDIEKFEKEAQHLSKNILRIKTVKEWDMVRESYVSWVEDFKRLVLKSILSKAEETEEEKKVLRAISDFCYFIINDLFMPKYDGEWRLSVEYGVDRFSTWNMVLYPPEGQKILFDSWKKRLNGVYQKYNRMRRDAFSLLYEYFDTYSKQGSMPDYYKEIPDSIEGIPVSWFYDETKDIPKVFFSLKDIIQFSKIALTDGIKILRNSKFSFLLHNLRIHVETGTENFMIGGRWMGLRSNLVQILAPFSRKSIPDVTRNFIHEVGHKYWDLMDKKDQDFFSYVTHYNKVVVLQKKFLEEFYSIIVKILGKEREVTADTLYDIFGGGLYKHVKDKNILFIYELMIFNGLDEEELFFHWDEVKEINNKNYKPLYNRLMALEGKELGEVYVTSYARSRGALEAFPELFSYVLMGYDVPHAARALFKTVTGV